jgi:hypothetical protein
MKAYSLFARFSWRCLTSCPSSSCVEVGRRIEDHLIAVLHAVADLERRAAIANQGALANMDGAVLHGGDAEAVAVEEPLRRGRSAIWSCAESAARTRIQFSGHSLLAGRELAQVEIDRTAIAMVGASGFIWAISGTRPATAPAAAKPAAAR